MSAACCPHSSPAIGIFLPWGLDSYKLGLHFSMYRVTVPISEHFLGGEAKTPCRRLDLNAWFCPELWLKSWFRSERCLSVHFHGLISFSSCFIFFSMFVSQHYQDSGLLEIKYLGDPDTEGRHSKKRWVQLISIRKAKNQPCIIMAYWDL